MRKADVMILQARLLRIRESIVRDESGTRTTFGAVLVDKENGTRIRIVQLVPFDGFAPGQRVELSIRAVQRRTE